MILIKWLLWAGGGDVCGVVCGDVVADYVVDMYVVRCVGVMMLLSLVWNDMLTMLRWLMLLLVISMWLCVLLLW